MPKRKSTGKKTRFEVFKRDGFACVYCGAHPPGVLLCVDHVVAVAAGGSSDADNLVTACEPCNQGKGARDLKVIPESLAVKAKLLAEREDQLLGYQEIFEAKRDRLEEEKWRVAEELWPGATENGANSRDLLSIKQFIEKLGLPEVLDMVDVARSAKPYGGTAQWKYFCGCCWRVYRRRQECA